MASSNRDAIASRYFQAGTGQPGAFGVVTGLDAAIAAFCPVRNSVYLCVPTAARAWTMTEAGVAAGTDLKVGEGFIFYIQNNSAGANTITITAGGGANVASGAGTFTIAQANTRAFFLRRISSTAHELTTFGTWTH
jgi:hypothetical protein